MFTPFLFPLEIPLMHYDSDYPEMLTKTTTVNRGRLEYPLQYDVAEGPYGMQVVAVRSVHHGYHDRTVVSHDLDSIEGWLAQLWHAEHVDVACYSLRDWYRAAQACEYCGLLLSGKMLDDTIEFKSPHNSIPAHWDDVRARCDTFMTKLEASA